MLGLTVSCWLAARTRDEMSSARGGVVVRVYALGHNFASFVSGAVLWVSLYGSKYDLLHIYSKGERVAR